MEMNKRWGKVLWQEMTRVEFEEAVQQQAMVMVPTGSTEQHTPAIAEAVGFGAAVEYLSTLGMEAIAEHEHQITEYALERLEEIPGVKLFGPSVENKGGVAAFTLEGVHPHDVAQILDRDGIAVRAGHYCAQPLHEKFGIPATSRASFYLYNTKDEIDLLVNGIYKVKELFG